MTPRWQDFRYEIGRRRQRALIWLVWRLPREVVKWSAVRVIAHATTGEHRNQVVPDLTAMDALDRWEGKA